MVVLGAAWAFLWHILPLGITDAEVGNIIRTGLPSRPESFVWSPWTANRVDEVSPLHTPVDLRAAKATEVRRGVARTWKCSFTIYQTRYQLPDGATADVCGWGPDWGTRMNMRVPWTVFTTGVVMAAFGIVILKRKAQPEN